jgi:hypothetical protein
MRSSYQDEVGILHVMRARCAIIGHHDCVPERSEVLADIEEATKIVGMTMRDSLDWQKSKCLLRSSNTHYEFRPSDLSWYSFI